VALIAYIFGASGIVGLSVDIGKILIIIFLVLAVISLLVSLVTGKKSDF
jgi:uncharacterized membrane protein YtjA (UPF0391 family)